MTLAVQPQIFQSLHVQILVSWKQLKQSLDSHICGDWFQSTCGVRFDEGVLSFSGLFQWIVIPNQLFPGILICKRLYSG